MVFFLNYYTKKERKKLKLTKINCKTRQLHELFNVGKMLNGSLSNLIYS